MSDRHVLLWTRSDHARDMISLAMSRLGYRFDVCRLVDEVLVALHDLAPAARRAVVLGPTFTRDEAVALHEELGLSRHEGRVQLILLEDVMEPLPARLVQLTEREPLNLPVRVRTLREALDRALAE